VTRFHRAGAEINPISPASRALIEGGRASCRTVKREPSGGSFDGFLDLSSGNCG
jgi:hypothetical protein